MNLVRGGFGQWTLVDHDLLLPHNLGRHALVGWALGTPKAPGLAGTLNSIVEGPPIASGVISNVLRNGGFDNQQGRGLEIQQHNSRYVCFYCRGSPSLP